MTLVLTQSPATLKASRPTAPIWLSTEDRWEAAASLKNDA